MSTHSPHACSERSLWRKGGLPFAVFGASCPSAAYALQVMVDQGWPSWLQLLVVSIGTIFTFIGIFIAKGDLRQSWKALESAEEIACAARRDAMMEAYGVLRPVLALLAQATEVSSVAQKRIIEAKMRQLAISLAANLGTNTRACFFEYVNTSPRELKCESGNWLGTKNRQKSPRPLFSEQDCGAGEDKFKIIDNREVCFVADVDQNSPPGWSGDRDYKTYIVAPVAAGDRVFGFLGVDSSTVGDLTEDHKRIVENLATVLAIGLAMRS